MGFNFRENAQSATALSEIMVGRTKMEADEVINQVLTITGFDFAPKYDKNGNVIINDETGEPDEYAIVIFDEEPKKYYCGGYMLTKICRSWVDSIGMPAKIVSADLAESGGVQLRFTRTKTKSGNNFTNVEVL